MIFVSRSAPANGAPGQFRTTCSYAPGRKPAIASATAGGSAGVKRIAPACTSGVGAVTIAARARKIPFGVVSVTPDPDQSIADTGQPSRTGRWAASRARYAPYPPRMK
jgi:hypothetical protein